MLYVLCTSKPSDGLLHYSYEYTHKLNELGMETRCLFIPHPDFNKQSYIDAINNKYRVYDYVLFDDEVGPIWETDGCLILGRSMVTLPYLNESKYTQSQKYIITQLMNKVIAVYSENHTEAEYQAALMYFNANLIVDICDREVYTNGDGEHFEKTINFSIYKDIEDKPICKHLFLGTNKTYYADSLQVMDDYEDSKILVYSNQGGLEKSFAGRHIFVPVPNLLGLFEKYVYTKKAFDPAPRLMQECKYYGKEFIYARGRHVPDGGTVYLNRDVKEPDCTPIFNAIDKLKRLK